MADEQTPQTPTTERIGSLSSRDLKDLLGDSNQLDSYPTRGFEDFLVALPSIADTPFELVHSLNSSDPYGVRYEVLQSPFPVLVYQAPADAWQSGLVVLRSTSNGGHIRIRLTVDDGDGDQLEANTADYDTRGFTVVGPLKSKSTLPSQDSVTLGTDFAAGFSYALNASHNGPSVDLGDDVLGVGWKMSSDVLGYSANRHALRFIANNESSVYRYAMQLSQATVPVAGEYYLTGGPGGLGSLTLGAPTATFGDPSLRLKNVYALAGNFGTVSLDNIQFPATQVASANPNNLDDYEEGTFTPILISDGGGVPTYTQQVGLYTKIGNFVYIQGRLTISALGTLGAGGLYFGGLPFSCSGTAHAAAVIPYWGTTTVAFSSIDGYVFAGTPTIVLQRMIAAGGGAYSTQMVQADLSASFDMILTAVYVI